jgi:hypothetical protein
MPRCEWLSDREFIGARVSLEVTEVVERDGDTVITAQVGGDGFNGPSHFTFCAAGDKLARMIIRRIAPSAARPT